MFFQVLIVVTVRHWLASKLPEQGTTGAEVPNTGLGKGPNEVGSGAPTKLFEAETPFFVI